MIFCGSKGGKTKDCQIKCVFFSQDISSVDYSLESLHLGRCNIHVHACFRAEMGKIIYNIKMGLEGV